MRNSDAVQHGTGRCRRWGALVGAAVMAFSLVMALAVPAFACSGSSYGRLVWPPAGEPAAINTPVIVEGAYDDVAPLASGAQLEAVYYDSYWLTSAGKPIELVQGEAVANQQWVALPKLKSNTTYQLAGKINSSDEFVALEGQFTTGEHRLDEPSAEMSISYYLLFPVEIGEGTCRDTGADRLVDLSVELSTNADESLPWFFSVVPADFEPGFHTSIPGADWISDDPLTYRMLLELREPSNCVRVAVRSVFGTTVEEQTVCEPNRCKRLSAEEAPFALDWSPEAWDGVDDADCPLDLAGVDIGGGGCSLASSREGRGAPSGYAALLTTLVGVCVLWSRRRRLP